MLSNKVCCQSLAVEICIVFEGLKNLGAVGSMLKQAQQMGVKLQELTEELKQRRAQGTAGAGLVTVDVNGAGEVLACRIDPSLIQADDREMLEDLIVAATNLALAKAKELHADAIRSLSGGLDLPANMNDLIGKLGGGA
jgi:DNA-binding YbaB/EbfC family protein